MKHKTIFYCTECGNETAKWTGKCSACGAWNSLEEAPQVKVSKNNIKGGSTVKRAKASLISELSCESESRFLTGLGELDRVLGGGAVRGSLVLVGGAPGIGKSTLLLQICGTIGKSEKVLYITGEESQRQLKMRAMRLGVDSGDIYVLAETDLNLIITAIEEIKPDVVVIDSIQTMYDAEVASAPGSVTQVRECTMSLMRQAKTDNFTAFVVGHINKEGNIAGPKVLEHMVDCILYFEGDRNTSYRILRSGKNRFGSTNEIGVFEMESDGLREVENPSEMLLEGRPDNAPGTCVTCVMEGTRPVLAEIQALVTNSGFNAARRNSNGVDRNRSMMLLAVLEKRGGLPMSTYDSYINVVGGLSVDEPAADLAMLLAVASSYFDMPLGADLAAVGEVGLSGEIRSVMNLNHRLIETSRLGFKRCVIPAKTEKDDLNVPDGLELIKVNNIREAIRAVFGE